MAAAVQLDCLCCCATNVLCAVVFWRSSHCLGGACVRVQRSESLRSGEYPLTLILIFFELSPSGG